MLLYSAGYVYARNSSNIDKTKIYWQCRNKNKKEMCPARAVTDGDYVIDQKGVHIHATNILQSDIISELPPNIPHMATEREALKIALQKYTSESYKNQPCPASGRSYIPINL